MDTAEIQTRIDAICKAMLAKGLREPHVAFRLECFSELSIYLDWKDGSHIDRGYLSDRKFKHFVGETPAETLANADKFVADLPSPEETRMREFMGALGKVIDLGRESNIEVAFMNPLVETMRKLSENILTDQRAA